MIACSLILAAALATAAAPEAPARRFALVAGANDGGPDRVRLRYATSDAHSVAEVLRELGGVSPSDAVVLSDPGVGKLRGALADLGERAASDDTARRVEVILYYSGHSDERGLLLGGERYAYADLRADLDALPADVRIAILDSCASGALVLGKGGTRVPAFMVDESSDIAGHAFLTSSSADEASQEAGRIGASFFTHSLVTGLRGAADVDRDQRVTLQEAYDFAHTETLARTEVTRRGTQHPQYEFDLIGTGDLVLTDVGSTASGLTLPEGLSGRVHVWDAEGKLAAELFKPAARTVELGLAPGRYRVVLEDEGQHWEGGLDLVEGELTAVDRSALSKVRAVATVARGDELVHRPVFAQHWPTARDITRRDHAVIGLVAGSARLDGLAVGLGGSAYDEVRGVQLSGFANAARGTMRGAQIASFANTAGDMEGLQLGLVNHARSLDGVSIGLVNVAETGSGLPIGALNVVGDGILDVEVWSSDLSLANIGLKSGTRSFYSLLAVGYDPFDEAGLSSVGGAVGVRPVWTGALSVDLDLFCMAHFPRFLHGDTVVATPALRVQVGLDLHARFGLFAGVSLGGQLSMQDPTLKVTHMPTLDLPVADNGVLRLYPGWFAGVRF